MTVTERPKINRPISAEEIAVIRAALERAPTATIAADVAAMLPQLRAIEKCGCGCDSVDFARHDLAHPSGVIADGTGTTSAGDDVGIIVWGRDNAITALEIYAFGEAGGRLPVPESIRPRKPEQS